MRSINGVSFIKCVEINNLENICGKIKQCNEPTPMKKVKANDTNKGRLLLKNISVLVSFKCFYFT